MNIESNVFIRTILIIGLFNDILSIRLLIDSFKLNSENGYHYKNVVERVINHKYLDNNQEIKVIFFIELI